MFGHVEMDASIMDGSTMQAGAVASVGGIRHPVQLARFPFSLFMSHLLLLGKFEYGGGPIFKVVLEC